MGCECNMSLYTGNCGCKSSYTGGSHFTNEQINAVRNKVEDNLFENAFYADEDTFSALFANPLRDLLSKGKDILSILTQQNPPSPVTNAAVPVSLPTSVPASLPASNPALPMRELPDNLPDDFDPIKYAQAQANEAKKAHKPLTDKESEDILGMPVPVFIVLCIVLVLIIGLVTYKLLNQ